MSTEYLFRCKDDKTEIHAGTRYAGGFRFFTIGPLQAEVEAWLSEHAACEVEWVSEYDL